MPRSDEKVNSRGWKRNLVSNLHLGQVVREPGAREIKVFFLSWAARWNVLDDTLTYGCELWEFADSKLEVRWAENSVGERHAPVAKDGDRVGGALNKDVKVPPLLVGCSNYYSPADGAL